MVIRSGTKFDSINKKETTAFSSLKELWYIPKPFQTRTFETVFNEDFLQKIFNSFGIFFKFSRRIVGVPALRGPLIYQSRILFEFQGALV